MLPLHRLLPCTCCCGHLHAPEQQPPGDPAEADEYEQLGPKNFASGGQGLAEKCSCECAGGGDESSLLRVFSGPPLGVVSVTGVEIYINFFCPPLTPVTPTTPLGGPLKTCKSQRSSAPSSTPTSTSQRAIDRRRRKFLGRAARTRLLPRDRRVAAARERGGGRSSTCMAAACLPVQGQHG